MKKVIIFLILTYLLFTINSSAANQNLNEKVLKIGVLLPLSGKFQDTGESFLKATQLAFPLRICLQAPYLDQKWMVCQHQKSMK